MEQKTNKSKLMIIIAIVVIVIVAVVGIVIFTSNKSSIDKPDAIDTSAVIENDYNKAIELAKNGDYKGARDIFKREDIEPYKDSKSYIYYCNAMEYYDLKCYGLAIERFTKCENLLNAKELKDELMGIVGKYNGTYYYQHPNTSALGYYMFVKDGKVDILSKSIYNTGDKVNYNYSFMGKYNENTKQYDLYVGTNFVKEPEPKNYEFLFYELPDGGIAISSQNGSVNTMYSGVYDKTSNETPEKK